MKYIITEEQSRNMDQSEVYMGPLGPSIKRFIDINEFPMIDKHIVSYIEKSNEYLIILWPKKHHYLNNAFCRSFTKKIRDFIPVSILTFALNDD